MTLPLFELPWAYPWLLQRILMSQTCSKFASKNKTLALSICLMQPAWELTARFPRIDHVWIISEDLLRNLGVSTKTNLMKCFCPLRIPLRMCVRSNSTHPCLEGVRVEGGEYVVNTCLRWGEFVLNTHWSLLTKLAQHLVDTSKAHLPRAKNSHHSEETHYRDHI